MINKKHVIILSWPNRRCTQKVIIFFSSIISMNCFSCLHLRQRYLIWKLVFSLPIFRRRSRSSSYDSRDRDWYPPRDRDWDRRRRSKSRSRSRGRFDRDRDREWDRDRERDRSRDWDRDREWDRNREWDRERDWDRGRGGSGRRRSRSPPDVYRQNSNLSSAPPTSSSTAHMSWRCHLCNEQVPPKQPTCGKCGNTKPNIESDGIANPAGKPVPSNFRPGDWMCPTCSRHVYASKPQCLCGNQKPQAAWDREKANAEETMLSTTSSSVLSTTPKSSSHQQHNQQHLPHQYQPTPDATLPPNFKPGDWICQSCGDHVFARKDFCRCGCRKSDRTATSSSISSSTLPANIVTTTKEERNSSNYEALDEEMRIILNAQKSDY